MDICKSPMMCNLCRRNPVFRAQHGIADCPQGMTLITAPTITPPVIPARKVPEAPRAVAPVPTPASSVCIHRGELIQRGTCGCGDGNVWACAIIGKQTGRACGPGRCKRFSIV